MRCRGRAAGAQRHGSPQSSAKKASTSGLGSLLRCCARSARSRLSRFSLVATTTVGNALVAAAAFAARVSADAFFGGGREGRCA
jgi:hypothetical protein